MANRSVLLGMEYRKKVLAALKRRPGARLADLVNDTGCKASTLSVNMLPDLEKFGHVRKQDKNFYITDKGLKLVEALAIAPVV